MKKLLSLAFVLSIALGLSGCGFMKKVGAKFKGKKENTEQTSKAESKDEGKMEKKMEKKGHKKMASGKKHKRIHCSMKKTYEKNHPCWHWKRGARIGKPGYGGKKAPQDPAATETKKEEKK